MSHCPDTISFQNFFRIKTKFDNVAFKHNTTARSAADMLFDM